MNVATSTLLLLCLLFPGMAFRRFYYSGAFSKQYATEDFGRLLLRTGAIAVVIHVGAYLLLLLGDGELARGYGLIADALLGAGETPVLTLVAWERIRDFVGVYAVLIPVGAIAGYLGQYLVQKAGLDRRFKILRFRNYWHYLLRGGVREFTTARHLLSASDGAVAYTAIDIVVATSEGDALYRGILVDYELGSADHLAALVLTNVHRRALSDDHDGDLERDSPADAARFYPVVGDLVVFPAAEIKNYNLRYVTLVDVRVAADQLFVSVNDADGDVTSAAYYNAPDA